MKKLLIIALTLLIAVILTLGVYAWTPAPKHLDTASIRSASQDYKARIIRDKWGVPHIYAKQDADAAFGLAYAHSEDDWQTIQETILFVRGSLAQHQGKEAAVTDYLMHLLKASETIEAKYETDLNPATRKLVEAYADGLNNWAIEHPDQVLPGVLPVTGKDIVAGFVARTPFFYGLDDDLGKLFADTRQFPVSEKQLASFIADGTPAPLIGSNAFAVAPGRSEDGHTRLLVNSHQPFTGPVAWYEARIKTEEGWDMVGSLFPGTPMILHGASPHLGWAHTVNMPDLLDIYVLETDNERKPTKYKLDGAWRDLEKSKANFRVKLFGNFSWPVSRDVLWSEHGPVLVTKHGVYAFRYAGIGEIGTVEQWYEMNRAQNFDAWQAAVTQQGIPSFNIVYADKEGNIGYYYNAKMPRRETGWNWRQYLPGNQSSLIWKDYHAFSDLPHTINPPAGWVFSANNTPFVATDSGDNPDPNAYPAYFGIETKLTNRARRTVALYTPDQQISEEEFLLYREDIYYAPESTARLLVDELLQQDFSAEPELTAAQDILKNWEGSTAKSDKAAALAVLTATRAKGYLLRDNLMDPVEALRSVVTDLQKHYGKLDPEWGNVNRLKRGDTNLPLAGAPDILRAIYFRDTLAEEGQLTAVAGDTYILYADWSNQEEVTIKTVHQFGSATLDTTSPHYDDQAPLFAEQKYKDVSLSLDELLKEASRDYTVGGR